MSADTRVVFAGVTFNNPVVAASGTFGFGREYSEYYDLSELGGICTKGLTLAPRLGNPPPRIAETPMGMLNSVGLQNPGVEEFIRYELPFMRRFDTRVIANIAGESAAEYAAMAERLSDAGVDMIEVNVSCPNVKNGGLQFGVSAAAVAEVTREVRRRANVPVMVKLSPNVTDITEMARAAESEGADAVSLINTLLGMRIDIKTRRPVLANNTGGLSGAAVLPVALRMIWQTRQAVRIPILGMGGITTGADAVEALLAGASLVGVGTASFSYPEAALSIRDGIAEYMNQNKIGSVSELTGSVILN
ncbi:MAG: dihydroorotate dehydrogenase [Oscillospiraceae bacterium]|jgi:dihydroorotate dehydrogenase (NAD+) catalytic subunit|nr:dihydroorotate dehydrogenase [Oscillospiraceae bacterium]